MQLDEQPFRQTNLCRNSKSLSNFSMWTIITSKLWPLWHMACVIEMYPRVWTSGLKALPEKAVLLSSPLSSWPLLYCLHLCTFLEPSLVKSNGKFKRDGKTPRISSETHIHENMSFIGCCPQKHFSISKVVFCFSWSIHGAEKWALMLNTRIQREAMLETSIREPRCSRQPEFKVQGSF